MSETPVPNESSTSRTESAADYVRSVELFSAPHSRLIVIDVQERLIPVIADSSEIVRRCRQLITAAGILKVPVSVTEQYPRGLGATLPELAALLPAVLEKVRFSAAEVLLQQPAFRDATERDQCIVIGIESHVCVLQTALDLLSRGFRVSVAADATGSRRSRDRDLALQRMADNGVTITTSESIMFEWCETAGTPEFKQIAALVREL